jgi:hypothetical protein
MADRRSLSSAVDRLLARVDRLVDRHEAGGQLGDRLFQQQVGLDQVRLDFGQVAPAMVGHARQQALDVRP